MIKEELYKIVVKEKGYVFLALFIVIKLLYSGFFVGNSLLVDYDVEKNKSDYSKILSSEENIRNYIEEYDNASSEVDAVMDQLLNKEISDEEYNEIISSYTEILHRQKLVDYLKNQRDYVDANDGTSYVYQNGWNTFFNGLRMDLLLLILLILFTSTLFTKEYETKMNIISKMCVKGGKSLFTSKLLTGLLVNETIVIIWWGLSLIIAGARYGLDGYNASIQSLYLFQECPWNLTILQVSILALGMLLLYGLLFNMTLCLVSVIAKNTIALLGILLGIIIIPCVLLPEKLFMKFPILSSYLYFDQFIFGVFDQETGRRVYMSMGELQQYAIISIIICIILVIISYIIYNGINIKKFRCVLPLICCCFLTGCQNNVENYSDIYSNLGWNTLISDGRDNVYSQKEICQMFEKNGVYEEQMASIIPCTVSKRELLYVDNSEPGVFVICGLDIDSSEKKIYYSNVITEDEGINYLKIRDKIVDTTKNNDRTVSGECCWRQGENVFYLSNSSIFMVKSKHKSIELISDVADSSVAGFGKCIYYVNKKTQLAKYDIEENSVTIIDEDFVNYIAPTETALVFVKGNGSVCSYSYETTTVQEICKSSDLFINADNNYLYFATEDDNWYKLNIKTGEKVDGPKSDYQLVDIKSTSNGEKVYVSELDADGNNITTEYE